ncbi:response regulator [Polaribacter sp. IC066]|uniref:response regulator n=1 Tax=unclassified Polaribacter TaxID=196858 RepID=UPI0021D13CE4|nr:response regulator [Polaribacter sp. IC066]
MEKELIRSKKVTEELARSKHNFLANMSHEIRTPMNAIIGISRHLQKSSLNDEQHSYLNIISTASENLLVIINDILDLSKLEANKLSFEKIAFKPRQVIENALKVMQYKAEEKGIQLTNSYCDRQLSSVLIGDPHRINQILLNVISNAIKFTEVGSVDICCNVLTENNLSQVLELKITDTGIGMDSLFLKKLFEKFTQEYESKGRNFGGTGLGMAITKSLVDNMEGDISVESKINEGTTISISFTLKKGQEIDLKKKDNTVVTATNLKGKRILVVDDNIMNRMVAKVILKDFDVIIAEVSNGEEAVNYLKNHKADLVLMDIQMPILNGYKASEVIRGELNLEVPIIALTANVMKGEKAKCLEAGMNDYLSKPFDEEQFLQIITTWIGKSNYCIS